MKANYEIRQAILNSGLKYWQVAEAYGVNDGNFSRKLRKELPESEKNIILNIVKKLKEDLQNAG